MITVSRFRNQDRQTSWSQVLEAHSEKDMTFTAVIFDILREQDKHILQQMMPPRYLFQHKNDRASIATFRSPH